MIAALIRTRGDPASEENGLDFLVEVLKLHSIVCGVCPTHKSGHVGPAGIRSLLAPAPGVPRWKSYSVHVVKVVVYRRYRLAVSSARPVRNLPYDVPPFISGCCTLGFLANFVLPPLGIRKGSLASPSFYGWNNTL